MGTEQPQRPPGRLTALGKGLIGLCVVFAVIVVAVGRGTVAVIAFAGLALCLLALIGAWAGPSPRRELRRRLTGERPEDDQDQWR